MVTICQMSQVKYDSYDEVWAIVRSLKYGNPHMRHVPELSPSWGLFRLYMQKRESGNWNKDTFERLYVPQFLKEMRGKEQQALLNELFCTNKRICLACFCSDEELCHRSIIGGMLQGAGLDVKGLSQDYSHYYDWWKKGVPWLSDNLSDVSKKECPEKFVSDYNGNVRLLYKLKAANTALFDKDLVTMCFTGRRPKDLCGYDAWKYNQFVSDLAKLIYEEFYCKLGVRRFITGGAQGFDQMAFWAVERVKTVYDCRDIENVVFVPFEHQGSRWAKKGCFSQAEYWMMIKRADMVAVVSNNNGIQSLFDRNHAMCDYSDYCLALYPDDGWHDNKGGTAECMRYAYENRPDLLRLGYGINEAGLYMGEVSAQ